MALTGESGSPEFLEAYRRALAAGSENADSRDATLLTKSSPGTLDALRELYLGSAEFKTLRASTQRETKYVIDAICRVAHPKSGTRGKGLTADLQRRHILKWRDGMADKPGAANKMMRVLKIFLNFAVERGLRPDNPANGIKLLKAGHFRSWTDSELAAFEARWPLGTLERTGYALALYTAQRREDLARMKWQDIAGEVILVRQSKTGAELQIHMHPELRKVLSAVHPHHEAAILAGKRGKALSPVYFGHRMATAIDAAGLPGDCVLHGLRKAAARIVRELGGDVASMTGHTSHQMVHEYTRGADQKRMSRDAVVRWADARRTQCDTV